MFDKSKYKLAVFDLDGTIFRNNTVSPAVGRSLLALASSGIQIAVASGRPALKLPPPVDGYGFVRYAVGSNGASIYDREKGEIVAECGIEPSLARSVAREIARHTNAFGFIYSLYGFMTSSYMEFNLRQFPESMHEVVRRAVLENFTLVDTADELFDRINAPVMKFTCRMPDGEIERFNRDILERFDVECAKADVTFSEITAKGVDKGSGVALICEKMGITLDEVIAFGDSGNDLPVLTRAGFAVVMDNAQPEVKAAADFIAPDVLKDGVAAAIKQLFGV